MRRRISQQDRIPGPHSEARDLSRVSRLFFIPSLVGLLLPASPDVHGRIIFLVPAPDFQAEISAARSTAYEKAVCVVPALIALAVAFVGNDIRSVFGVFQCSYRDVEAVVVALASNYAIPEYRPALTGLIARLH